MRLISCHIENFGRLSDFDFDFQDGCNTVIQENGWGKSTFAAFLKVMFFGFSGEGKRSDLECERKRYMPWQGGTYGGSVVFDRDGKKYKLVREFATKANGDFFELRDYGTNLVSNDYDEAIGKTIFQVDGESFLRTAYITQNDIKIEMNAEISAKMGGLAGLSDDLANHDKADSKLQEWLNANTKKRKTGKLAKLEEEIAALKQELRRADDLDRSIDELKAKKKQDSERKAQKEEEQAVLVEEQRCASERKAASQVQEQYGEICAQVQERKEVEENARSHFPGEIPNQAELQLVIEEANQLDVKEGRVKQYRLSESDENRLGELGRIFREESPDAELLDRYADEISSNSREKIALAKELLNPVDEENYWKYQDIYGDSIESDRDSQCIAGLENEWGERVQAIDKVRQSEQQLEGYREKYEEVQEEIEAGKKSIFGVRPIPIAMAVAGIGLAVIGMVLGGSLMTVLALLGAVVLLVGVVFMLLPLAKKSKTEAVKQNAVQLERRIAEAEEQCEALRDVIREYDERAEHFLQQFGENYNEYTFLTQLAAKKAEIKEYRGLLAKKAKADSAKERVEAIEHSEQDIRDYVMKFLPIGGDSDLLKCVLQVKEMYKEYRALLKQKENFETAEKEYRVSLQKVQNYIRSLQMQPEEEPVGQLGVIRDHLLSYRSAHKEYEDAEGRKYRFEEEHPNLQESLAAETPTTQRSLEEINDLLMDIPQELRQLTKNIMDYDVQINELVDTKAQLEEKENQLALKQEEYEALQVMYGLVGKTKELLQEAKEAFTARYIGPTRDAFDKYYAMVEQSKAGQYHFDANMKITAVEYGRDREIEFLSRGYQDLVGVCYRLAVLDAMYGAEKPLIILDDPFVNLDDEKLVGAMELLKKVSEEYQVVYFTCRN